MGAESFEYKFCIKMCSEDAAGYMIASECRMMEREIQNYLRLVPRMKMTLDSSSLQLPVMEPVFGAYDRSGNSFNPMTYQVINLTLLHIR